MKSSRFTVVGLGDLVIDVLAQANFPIAPPQTQVLPDLDVQPGGMANFLVAGNRLGMHAVAMDVLGKDLFGKWLVSTLETEGIDVKAIKCRPEVTSKIVITLMDGKGQHVFLGHLGSTQLRLHLDRCWKKELEEAAGLFVVGYSLLEEYLGECAIEAMRLVKKYNGKVFFDPGPMVNNILPGRIIEAIQNSDVLLMTEEECELLIKTCGCGGKEGLFNLGPSLICIKLGAKGCNILDRGMEITCPGYKVDVKDTSGAGDSFAAAFMYGFLNGYSPEDVGKLANAMGAAKVGKFGTGLNVPNKDEIIKILVENRENSHPFLE